MLNNILTQIDAEIDRLEINKNKALKEQKFNVTESFICKIAEAKKIRKIVVAEMEVEP